MDSDANNCDGLPFRCHGEECSLGEEGDGPIKTTYRRCQSGGKAEEGMENKST
jgi:hypothetical protein